MGLLIEIIFLIVIAIIIFLNIILIRISKTLKDIPNKTELSGVEIARIISDKYSDKEPHIIKKKGFFLDHYNKDRNVIKLSGDVFDGTNMYAGLISFHVAINTSPEKEASNSYNKFVAILVLISYIVLILGAFLSNGSIIHFSLILFILSFVLELLIINKYGFLESEMDTYLSDEELIKPYNENKVYAIVLSLINVANLPYRFIEFFR